ncbi:MAG: nucleoside-diphosphate sugar epimerase/dehydratase [Eubacteriales bacterium]|nr:nucleoside-diphosphate sugar epimerase/dehydratase [Eubacteriales bacterium]
MTIHNPKPNKTVGILLWLLTDAILLNLAMVLAQVMRYTTTISYEFFDIYFRIAPAMTIIGLILFAAFGLYRTMWQYASVEDLFRIAVATLSVSIATLIFSLFANHFVKPENLFRLHRMVYLLFWLTSMLLVGLSRLTYRILKTKETISLFHRRKDNVRRNMIVGAGWLGASVVHEMQRGHYGSCMPVIVVDDDKARTGSRLSGVPVVRGSGNILKLASDYDIDDIIIAISTPHNDLQPVIDKCLATGCHVRRVSPVLDVGSDHGGAGDLRELNISDLLGRPEEQLDMTQVAAFVRDKTVLITGGGGSIGGELCRTLLPLEPKRIVLYDISENYMYDLFADLQLYYHRSLKDRLILCVGSVCDPKRLNEVFDEYQPEIVLHAAAHKHVPLMEDCPSQAVKNNVFGTNQTALAAIAHHVQRFVLISTDKAVNPTNIMGATKRLAEMIIEARNVEASTVFTAVRFGNVLGSHGSVVPLFEQQIRAGGPLTLTHPDIIRYFMTIPEAASLVLQSASIAKGGEIFVLDMGRPVKIRELAERMIQLYAPHHSPPIEIVYTGLRPGEKLYEELLLAGEGVTKTEKEKIFVAQPEVVDLSRLDAVLLELQRCIDENGDMRACLHRLVPTFKEPEAVNAAVASTEAKLAAGA